MSESTKSITISGRISEDDHQFLMGFPLAGKVTISEKLRHICTFFRQYHTNLEGFAACLEQLNMALRPALNDIKEMENEEGINSELVTRLLNYVPEGLPMEGGEGGNVGWLVPGAQIPGESFFLENILWSKNVVHFHCYIMIPDQRNVFFRKRDQKYLA